MAPDIDVIGFRFGVHYGDLLGHRGITHSLLFAALLASVAFFCVRSSLSPPVSRKLAWTYLFLATASHGLLDALTDGSGLGVMFFWPFDSTRYFFPITPIAMSPIGMRFFSERGLSVILSEVRWVWIPSLAFALIAFCARRILTTRAVSNDQPV
jgi:inner membrane protein